MNQLCSLKPAVPKAGPPLAEDPKPGVSDQDATLCLARPAGNVFYCWALAAGTRRAVNLFYCMVMFAGSAGATEYFVAPNGADTGNNGLGWDQPFKTISNAVAQADADVVTVSNGTYNIGAEIVLSTNIRVRSVQGGLSGAANTVVKQTAASTRVFRTTHTNAVIEGLTITGGSVGAGQGGGVYMAGGLVRDCIVSNNLAPAGAGSGGNIYMNATGSTVSNCIITAGAAGGRTPTSAGGSGIFAGGNNKILYCQIIKNVPTDGYSMAAGILAQSTDLIRNCLIAGNSHNAHNNDPNAGYGAGIYGGRVESCTIMGNTCSYGKPGAAYNCAYVSNSIVYGNYAWGDDAGTFKITANYSGGSYAYSCATPLPAGAGNTAVEPKFVNAAGGDYRLLLPGPMVDKGSNQTWMAGALDLAGAPRITNAVGTAQIVDMGAYEYVPGALKCSLAADVTSVLAPSNVVFTAYVGGTNTSISSYTWDFGDGNTTNGSALAVVTNTYGAGGLYTVTLTVSNDANEAFTVTNTDYITAWGATVYVWTNSPTPRAPYATWTTAARKMQDVVGNTPAGVTNCWVTNGTYNIVSELVLSTPIRVHSVQGGLSGASNTIVRQTASGQSFTRVFRTAHTGAVIEGLTITGGSLGSGQGGGVYMAGGLVRDCIVTGNSAGGGSGTGGNIYMDATGSTVSNCIITAGYAGGRTPTSAGGSGIFAGGNNKILYCQVLNNVNLDTYSMAAGILAQPTDLIRNCLIAGNRLAPGTVETYSGYGGGVYGGKVESCTIVSNTCAFGRGPGGVYNCAYVSNSIVYGNFAWGDSGGGSKITNNYSGTAFAYSDTVPTNGLTGAGNTDLAPRFVGGGDYQLQKGSPCVNAGNPVADSWMTGATDLVGAARVQNKRVDMGAYETYFPPQGSLFLMR